MVAIVRSLAPEAAALCMHALRKWRSVGPRISAHLVGRPLNFDFSQWLEVQQPDAVGRARGPAQHHVSHIYIAV